MKLKFICTIFALSVCMYSCNSQTSKKESNSQGEDKVKNSEELTINGKTYTPFKTTFQTQEQSQPIYLPITFYDVKDTNNGLTISSVPLPGSWEQKPSAQFQFEGPKNMKILGLKSGNFYYSNDPLQMQMFNSIGMKIREPQSFEQIIQQDFINNAAPSKRKLTKTYQMPAASEFFKNFDELLYKVDLTPKNFEGNAYEWEDPDGTSFLTIIVKHQEMGPTADSWGYSYDVIQSPKANFEQAKRILINSMVNQEINMAWVNRANSELKTKIDASNAAHQAMMNEVKRNMEVFQEGQRQRRADREILDNRISNYILGKSDVVNPETGAKAKVEAGSTYYWINEKGEYITTESYSWNPNENEPYKKCHTWTRHQL